MLSHLPHTVILKSSSGDVTLSSPWTKALALVLVSQSLATLVLLYGLTAGTLLCSCTAGPTGAQLSASESRLEVPSFRAWSSRGSLTLPSSLSNDSDLENLKTSQELVPPPHEQEDTDCSSISPLAGYKLISRDGSEQQGRDGVDSGQSSSMISHGDGRKDTEESGTVTSSPRTPHLYGMNHSLFPPGFVSFEVLLTESKSDKKIHRFGHMYSEYLDPLRLQQRQVNMLEIGLRDGDSVNLWSSAFPAGKIYGLEYNPNPLSHATPVVEIGGRLKVFHGDQENVTLLKEILEQVNVEVGLLDFIVDDGGHTMQQQITSFTHLFPLVKPGGFYFIEDLQASIQTSYWRNKCYHHWNLQVYCYGGGRPGKKNTTVDLMKSLIDVLNADFIMDHENLNKLGSGVYSVNAGDHLVGSLQCWRNMCAIRRKFDDQF